MAETPYDYASRTGICPISWADFHALCKGLARAIAAFDPQLILPIGRAGYYPGTLLAHMLQVEIYPIRLSRRVKDMVAHERPQWLLEPPTGVRDQRVLVVDEICSTGETLLMASERVTALGAAVVQSAVLYAHSRATAVPDYIGLITDALILNPWDREILVGGEFHFHPEYVAALAEQGLEAERYLSMDLPEIAIAKG